MGAEEAAYLAGLVDGEGYLSLRIHYRKRDNQLVVDPALQITLLRDERNSQLLDWIRQRFGGYICSHGRGVRWVVKGKALEKVLDSIDPYLKLKREEARVIRNARALINEKGNRLWTPELAKKLAEFQDSLFHCKNPRGEERKWTGSRIVEFLSSRKTRVKLPFIEAKAKELRAMGLTYEEIAAKLGVGMGTAYCAVTGKRYS